MGKELKCDKCGGRVDYCNNFFEFIFVLFVTRGRCENCKKEHRQKIRDMMDKEEEARRLGRAEEEGRIEARENRRRGW